MTETTDQEQIIRLADNFLQTCRDYALPAFLESTGNAAHREIAEKMDHLRLMIKQHIEDYDG